MSGEVYENRPIMVTVSDPETGQILESRRLANDYVVITAGDRYVNHVQIMGTTVMLSIKRERR